MHATGITVKRIGVAAALAMVFGFHAFAQEDPPSRVARLNHVEGNVSMEPAGVDDWAPAVINHPFTTGDYLFADNGARAELHLDTAVIRVSAQTSFGFLNLNDQVVQIKLSEGDMYFRLHNFGANQVFEVDTPNAAVTLLRDGVYRFRVDPNGAFTFVVVREGEAEITGGGQAFTLNPGNSASVGGTDQISYDVETAPEPDDFDNWCQQRDAREAHLASARYVPPTVIGYEDLDEYGGWQDAPDYGAVWYPRQVDSGWAPYQAGHWAWVAPWGWTWVDDAPWGFAPFHYGRWAYISGRWGWCPGPIAVGYRGPVVRPYYAPALVAWFGGSHWGVGISGGGPSLGWVALGFGEVFTPSYVVSRGYFNNVNVYNTRIVRNVNITNVYNTVYVNKTVYNQQFANSRAPGAVTAMRQDAFASGRGVREGGGYAVRQADLGRIQGGGVVAPPVAPTRQALAPTLGRQAARPSAQIAQRQVVARNTPPPQPAAFAAHQQFLQQHAGQAVNFQAMRQAAPQTRPAAFVRQAPAVGQATAARPGQRFGNQAAIQRPNTPAAYQGSAAPAVTQRPNAPAASQPVTHGVPPNLRQGGNNAQPAAQDGRFAKRTPQPAPTSAERTQTAEQPNGRFTERTQTPPEPRPVRPQIEEDRPPVRQNSPDQRPAPEVRNEPRPQPEAREEAHPAVRTEENRPASSPERGAPEHRASPQEHRATPPTEHKDTKPAPRDEHKEDHKDKKQ